MDSSLAGRLRYVAEAAWRRRYFILLPFLVSIPLSVFVSGLLPQKYVVRTMLIMQENNSDLLLLAGRLQGDTRPLITGPALMMRKAALEALLKSRRVLEPALEDIMGEEYPKARIRQAEAREELAKSISLELIGHQFIEFRLKGTKPKQMGENLRAITSRFLESLLMADRGSASAAQLVLESRKLDLSKAEKAVSEFEREIAGGFAGGNGLSKASRLKETTQRLEAKKRELRAVNLAIDEVPSEAGGGPSGLKARRDELRDEVGQLLADVQAIETPTYKKEMQTDELGKRLRRRLKEAKANLKNFAKRYANPGASSLLPLELVKSPENIRMIDPPRDPEFAVVSRLTYIIAGILAGLVLGCSAAIVAEALDQRLRYPEEFVAVFGAPMICRLPNSRHVTDDPLSLENRSTQPSQNVTQLRPEDRRKTETRASKL